nr:HAMP domain-containing sensor histidine kinase [Parabacteroides goldsteinii]
MLVIIAELFSGVYLRAETHRNQIDSLSNVLLNTIEPSEKLPVLIHLSKLFWQKPEEISYLKELIDLSLQLDSLNYAYEGYSALCRYYYNESQLDSLIFVKNQLDSLCRQHAVTPPVYFQARILLCKYYQGILNYELAISEAFKLLNDAKKAQDNYGLMMAKQSIGFAYQAIGRNKDAVIAYREGLEYLHLLENNPTYEIQYISEMLPSFLDENLLIESKQLLDRYSDLYQTVSKLYKARGIPYRSVWHLWLVNSYYAELYMKMGQLDKAGKYIEKADKYAANSTVENMKYPYYRIKALYCFKSKDYKSALKAIDQGLAVEVQPNYLKLKIDILRADGQKTKAIATYEDLFSLDTQIRNDAFNRQIDQLRLLNDLNDQKQQTLELQRQNDKLIIKQQLVKMGMGISLLLLILITLLVCYSLHSNKLKNALQREKDSLVKLEKQLRIAKENAEEANRHKTAFIAKVSHEIRTPLNAIVGFSLLLSEDDDFYSEEEKKGFAGLIKSNFELLMNIVNNILDLSLLEADRLKPNISTYDAIACCREVIEETKHLVPSGVKLIFTPPVGQYIIETDKHRFKQVLKNLLGNAFKFTQEGEITLTFEIEEDNRQVRLSVTDTGCGIPIEKQVHIFDRFEKINEFVQGAGLGLAISQRISQLLKGNLFIDPTYTKGARFVFVHPVELTNKQQV